MINSGQLSQEQQQQLMMQNFQALSQANLMNMQQQNLDASKISESEKEKKASKKAQGMKIELNLEDDMGNGQKGAKNGTCDL